MKSIWVVTVLTVLPVFCACATMRPAVNQQTVSLEKANWKAVVEENIGLEINWEDVKDVRDYYRGGVQQKAEAEKKYEEKDYPQAMKLYQRSNDYFTRVLQYINADQAEYSLYEDTNILFFPHLLTADNDLKMGTILQVTGQEKAARTQWKRAISSVKESLKTERTEWALNLQKELFSLLPP